MVNYTAVLPQHMLVYSTINDEQQWNGGKPLVLLNEA